MGQVYAQRTKQSSSDKVEDVSAADNTSAPDVTALQDGIDDILDEIDELLTENAVQMAVTYRQTGGE